MAKAVPKIGSREAHTRRYGTEVCNRCHTPRKSSNDLQQKGTCTRNRHRWVGREYLGARDNSL